MSLSRVAHEPRTLAYLSYDFWRDFKKLCSANTTLIIYVDKDGGITAYAMCRAWPEKVRELPGRSYCPGNERRHYK